MNNELKQIKKLYGEDMMHFCRSKFPRILEHEGELLRILTENIAPTKSLYKDITDNNYENDFVNWIKSFVDYEVIDLPETDKTPFELLEEAGYILYECHSEEEVQKFRHYYSRLNQGETPLYNGGQPEERKGEELCTFNGGRLDDCHVFFAVKKNVDEIKREDFSNPKRQDAYGTSVISIQFSRGRINTLSIKNRYNHTVTNPDATFGNNLENIIPGLTDSFEKHYGFNIEQETNEDGYFLTSDLKYYRGNDGRYYRYNIEMDGVHYCNDNIIIDHGKVVTKYAKEKERYVFAEHALIDLKEKTVTFPYPSIIREDDSFVNSINAVGKIKNIEVVKNGDNRTITIKYEEGQIVKIEIDRNNAIVSYQNDYVKEIESCFLTFNTELSSLSLKNCEIINNDFLEYNKKLKDVSLDKVRKVGPMFLNQNQALTSISMPELEELGNYSLGANENLTEINMPKLKSMGDYCFSSSKLKRISFKELEYMGRVSLMSKEMTELDEIDLPKLKRMGDYCFSKIRKLNKGLSLPELEEIGNYNFENLEEVPFVDLPKVVKIGKGILSHENTMTSLSLPNVLEIKDDFLRFNTTLRRLDVPKVKKIGPGLLFDNDVLEEFNAPELIEIKYCYGQNVIQEIIERLRNSHKVL